MHKDIGGFPGGTTVGLIGMSGKPVHAGHIQLIEMAANENDYVVVFVSLSDRHDSKSKITIRGTDMDIIWTKYLMSILPDNVIVTYSRIPVADMYEQIEAENKRFSEGEDVATYNIYSDPDDLAQRFSDKQLSDYAGEMWDAGLIIPNPIKRTSTVDVSGTKMRAMIASGDEEQFKSYLPDQLTVQQQTNIWNLLSKSATS